MGTRKDKSPDLYRFAEAVSDLFYIVRAPEFAVVYVSPSVERVLGFTPERFLAQSSNWLDHVYEEDRERVRRAAAAGVENKNHYVLEYRLWQNGRKALRWFEDRVWVERDARGHPKALFGAMTDITARKEAESQLRKLSRVVEQTSDLVYITDRRGVIEYVNAGAVAVTGYREEEILGRKPNLFKSGEHPKKFYAKLWRTINAGEPYRAVFINRRKDGGLYYEEKTITPLKDEQGNITHFVSTGKDVTERMEVQAQLDYLAFHDPVTDLPNRALFRDRLEQALMRAQREEYLVGLLFLDLDRFKQVNDSLGHTVGDHLLRAVGERIRRCLRDTDTVARWAGDEFTIILERITHVDQVAAVARKLLEAFSEPFRVDGHELHITTSIGIALCPLDDKDAERLIKDADTAMYHAKDIGPNGYQFYSAEMSARALERLALETELHRAIEREEFVVHYQPIVEIANGRILGVEALLRWRHPEQGLTAPAAFIPVLEDTGLIVPVTRWVLRQVGAQYQACRAAGLKALSFAVNLTVRCLAVPDMLRQITAILDDCGLDPKHLVLEITESVLMHDSEETVSLIHALKDLGIRIALDDFGTGQSSLSHLRRIPIDIIKIDRDFVRDVTHDRNDAELVGAIIAMAHNLNITVIAEGVETEEQLAFLRGRGCDAFQGYLFSPAVPADEMFAMLTEGRRLEAGGARCR